MTPALLTLARQLAALPGAPSAEYGNVLGTEYALPPGVYRIRDVAGLLWMVDPDHRRPQYGDYLARMEQQRRAESVATWFWLVIAVVEIAAAAGWAYWLTSGLDGHVAVGIGALVCGAAFLVIDTARVAFLSWILPSVANRLRGYTMPDDRGPDA